jgi:hypothetical protein
MTDPAMDSLERHLGFKPHVRRLSTASFGIAVCVSQLLGQSRVEALNGALLTASVDTLAVTVEQPGRVVPVAVAVQSLKRVKRANVDAWEQIYRWYGNNGDSSADTLWYTVSNLRPIENHRHNSVHDAVTVFGPSSAHTVLIPRSGGRQVSDTAISALLYASGEFESIVRVSPLRPGYKAQYNLYYGGGTRSVRPGPFEVVRTETIKTRGGHDIECWVVDAKLSEALNTFWIDKKTRKLVKLENHEDPTAAFVFRR